MNKSKEFVIPDASNPKYIYIKITFNRLWFPSQNLKEQIKESASRGSKWWKGIKKFKEKIVSPKVRPRTIVYFEQFQHAEKLLEIFCCLT